jgi:endoglucanase
MNFQQLAHICELPGAPGFETKIRNYIIQELQSKVDSLEVDYLGNIIALKKGKSDAKKIMVAAHLDEIGFIVNHIDDKGFIKFLPLGGFDPKTLTSQRVIVHGKKDFIGVMGSKPIHIMSPDERNKSVQLNDFFIDLGMPTDEVKQYVEIGNPITRERSLIEMGNCINGKSIDNRVSVYILLEVLLQLENIEIPFDFYGVFTVQEEVGIRGAQTVSLKISPDFGIGLDTTIAFDVPGAQAHESVTKLGEGAAIKIMDASTICDYRMVSFMKEVATKNNIKWQPEILPAGGTDTAALQRHNIGGAIAGAISIPTRHIHQTIETANKNDIDAAIALLLQCIKAIDDYDWNFR